MSWAVLIESPAFQMGIVILIYHLLIGRNQIVKKVVHESAKLIAEKTSPPVVVEPEPLPPIDLRKLDPTEIKNEFSVLLGVMGVLAEAVARIKKLPDGD